MAYNPILTINLNKLFDTAFKSEPISYRRELRPIISRREFVNDFKKRFIRTIRDRVRREHVDKNDNTLVPYSKKYKESDVFSVLKSGSSVDLTLSGEMLESIEGVSRDTEITFQFKGARNKNVAHGHINGSNNLPKRDFFGMPAKDQIDILKELVKFFATRDAIFLDSDIAPEKISRDQVDQSKVSDFNSDVFDALEVGAFSDT